MLPGFDGSAIEEAIEVEAVRRDLGDRVDAVAQQLPERSRASRAAGKSAADADDGDRARAAARRFVRGRHPRNRSSEILEYLIYGGI